MVETIRVGVGIIDIGITAVLLWFGHFVVVCLPIVVGGDGGGGSGGCWLCSRS